MLILGSIPFPHSGSRVGKTTQPHNPIQNTSNQLNNR
nr:MAG TPA: hypothetical protein [Caudoviricetes sp.]